jgi:hypothetical protein
MSKLDEKKFEKLTVVVVVSFIIVFSIALDCAVKVVNKGHRINRTWIQEYFSHLPVHPPLTRAYLGEVRLNI